MAVDSRQRRSFARLETPLELPDLIGIQKDSFAQLVDTEKGLLRETINDVSPIEDYTGNLAVQFVAGCIRDGGSIQRDLDPGVDGGLIRKDQRHKRSARTGEASTR